VGLMIRPVQTLLQKIKIKGSRPGLYELTDSGLLATKYRVVKYCQCETIN
jgi:hypothetical protein